jgi:L-threonylcarbamoyladenylate synthase
MDPADPDPRLVAEVAFMLKKGGVVVYPTDTLYGLGGDGFNSEAVHRIMILKGRDTAKPFPYIIDAPERLRQWRVALNPVARAISEQLWPGPVSLVVRGCDELPRHVLDRNGTVCLRVPENSIARAVAGAVGGLLVATSANPAGHAPARSADEAAAYFRGEIDAVVDGGASVRGEPSTIVDVTGHDAIVLREGAVTSARIRAVIDGVRN